MMAQYLSMLFACIALLGLLLAHNSGNSWLEIFTLAIMILPVFTFVAWQIGRKSTRRR